MFAFNSLFSKDTIRDMLQNPYYMGKVRYKGMSVRTKGISYRSTTPQLSDGQHQAIVPEALWYRVQEIRASRSFKTERNNATSRVHLLKGVIVCSHCGRKMRAQTPSNSHSYYREDSHLKGHRDCPVAGRGVRTDIIDEQIESLVKCLKLPSNWQQVVKEMLKKKDNGPDPDQERRDINEKLRRLRESFEKGLFEGEEYIFWKKVQDYKKRLSLLKKPADGSINQAAQTLLSLEISWDWATSEERYELVHIMLLEVGCDVDSKMVLRVKPRLDFEILFRLFDG